MRQEGREGVVLLQLSTLPPFYLSVMFVCYTPLSFPAQIEKKGETLLLGTDCAKQN